VHPRELVIARSDTPTGCPPRGPGADDPLPADPDAGGRATTSSTTGAAAEFGIAVANSAGYKPERRRRLERSWPS